MRMRLWIGLLAAAFAALPASAQETRGNINGVVEDAGGVVPGAGVRITNADTGQTQQLVTSDRGYFEAVLLNPGTYAVRVELQGFKTLTRTGISLAVGQTVSLTLTLEVGQLTENIEVRAGAWPASRSNYPSGRASRSSTTAGSSPASPAGGASAGRTNTSWVRCSTGT